MGKQTRWSLSLRRESNGQKARVRQFGLWNINRVILARLSLVCYAVWLVYSVSPFAHASWMEAANHEDCDGTHRTQCWIVYSRTMAWVNIWLAHKVWSFAGVKHYLAGSSTPTRAPEPAENGVVRSIVVGISMLVMICTTDMSVDRALFGLR